VVVVAVAGVVVVVVAGGLVVVVVVVAGGLVVVVVAGGLVVVVVAGGLVVVVVAGGRVVVVLGGSVCGFLAAAGDASATVMTIDMSPPARKRRRDMCTTSRNRLLGTPSDRLPTGRP
jgi:hypothetical protein